jgi:hypothetical protein
MLNHIDRDGRKRLRRLDLLAGFDVHSKGFAGARLRFANLPSVQNLLAAQEFSIGADGRGHACRRRN